MNNQIAGDASPSSVIASEFRPSFARWVQEFGRKTLYSPIFGLALGVVIPIVQWAIPSASIEPLFILYTIQAVVILIILAVPVNGPNRVNSVLRQTETDSDGKVGTFGAVGLTMPTIDLEYRVAEESGYRNEKEWMNAIDAADRASREFRPLWRAIWWSWLGLYSILALMEFTKPALGQISLTSDVFEILKNVFSNAANVAILACYYALSRQTIDDVGTVWHERYKSFIRRWIVILSVAVTLYAILLAYHHFEAYPYGPAPIDNVVYIVARGIEYTLALIGAVSLSLFIGRLNSRFFGLPLWFLSIMFAYAAIQPFFPILREIRPDIPSSTLDIARIAIVNLALALKILLFVFVAWAVRSGRLLYYFIRLRRIMQQAQLEWERFSLLLDYSTPRTEIEAANE